MLRQVILNRQRYARPFMVGEYVLSSMDVTSQMQLFGGEMLRLECELLAGRVLAGKDTFTVQHPASWWQHLKHSLPRRFQRRWWQKRWPVRMTETKIDLDFTRWETFPKASLQLPVRDFGYGVIYDELVHLQVSSPWHVTGPAEEKFASRRHLASALSHLVTPEPGYYYRPMDLLEGLAKLGVNPDQLVRMDTIDRIL